MNLNFLPEILCGAGYTLDWDAISSIATVLAVIAALWIAIRDKRDRRLEQLELEARAASMASLTLSGFSDVLGKAINHIKETGGLTIDQPGTDILYCVENCQSIIDREAFFHQLPTSYIDSAELVVSLARKWIREIDVRRKIQNDPELQFMLNWRDAEGVEKIGSLLRAEAINLRKMCMHTRDSFAHRNSSIYKRIFKRSK